MFSFRYIALSNSCIRYQLGSANTNSFALLDMEHTVTHYFGILKNLIFGYIFVGIYFGTRDIANISPNQRNIVNWQKKIPTRGGGISISVSGEQTNPIGCI